MRLKKIFDSAIPWLSKRSLREAYSADGAPTSADTPESSTLILKHYDDLVRDLNFLNSLLVIARNMLAIKETAQDGGRFAFVANSAVLTIVGGKWVLAF